MLTAPFHAKGFPRRPCAAAFLALVGITACGANLEEDCAAMLCPPPPTLGAPAPANVSGPQRSASAAVPAAAVDPGGAAFVPAAATTGPRFAGSGSGFRPLTAGCGPETASLCGGACETGEGAKGTTILSAPETLCFGGEGSSASDKPVVVVEQVLERTAGLAYAHLRVTFDPSFTDNTYGAGSVGWPQRRGHRFSDLLRSDHTELRLEDASGREALRFKIDLLSDDSLHACGFGTLGVSAGDGALLVGDPQHVLAVATSLDRNLGSCGYCLSDACGPNGDCTVHSPTTDDSLSPNPLTPNWDYRQVYEAWVNLDAFGDVGFGSAALSDAHSSPAKGPEDTIAVVPTPCPPEWDEPYCPPGTRLRGADCVSGLALR